MKWQVCIKQVPDVNAPIRVENGQLAFDSGRAVLDAYAASAVEEALVLSEQHGGAVTVVLAGPDKAAETLRKALAMGADDGVHLQLDDDSDIDALGFAKGLAAHLKTQDFDVIALGKQSQDTDAGLTGAMLADLLGLPYATNAVGLEQDGDTLVVTRQGDTGRELIALPTPCLVTCSNDMNDPRIPKLKDIMKSKKKPVDQKPFDAPARGTAFVTVTGYEDLPDREPGQLLDGSPEEQASTLVQKLEL